MTSEKTRITRAFPFLQNFPFGKEFEMEISNPPVMAAMFDEEWSPTAKSEPVYINFVYNKKPMKSIVSIHKNELIWIAEVAESITNLDRITKVIQKGLKSRDIFTKRDAVIEADKWLSAVKDSKISLSQETAYDVMQALLAKKSLAETVSIINAANTLYSKKGVVQIAKGDLDIIFSYFEFKLIYTKLILGIVIASKISI